MRSATRRQVLNLFELLRTVKVLSSIDDAFTRDDAFTPMLLWHSFAFSVTCDYMRKDGREPSSSTKRSAGCVRTLEEQTLVSDLSWQWGSGQEPLKCTLRVELSVMDLIHERRPKRQ